MTPSIESVVSCLERESSLCSRIVETKICPLCRGPIEGSLASIEATLVCVGCELLDFQSKASDDECVHTVSEWEAVNVSGCLPNDLSRLRCLEKKTGERVEQLYLRGEVCFLRNLRRKEKVEEVLGIKLGKVHPVVRHFLLGDYLKQQTECVTCLLDVKQYKSVHKQATDIIKRCEFAHPQAALDFCIVHPYAISREFYDLKEKMKKVFQVEGRRILHALTAEEREGLKHGPLEDVYEAFHAEEPDDVIRGYLKQWFDEATIDVIMADDGWRNREWASGSEDRVASKLKEFWQEKLRRKEELTNALKVKRLSMPDSCINCEAYMNGIDDLSLKEIVAGVDLSGRLRSLEFEKDKDEWVAAFSTLFHSLKIAELNYYSSINMAIQKANEVHRERLARQAEEQNDNSDEEDEEDWEDEEW